MVLAVNTNPAWALDWHDPEWTGLGCPSKLSGDWTPLTDSPYAGSKIEFKPNGVTLSSKKNSSVYFTFAQNPKDGQYLHLKQLSEDLTSFPRYLKIRPHIAVQSISEGKKYTLCKIKVFLFESKQKADQMSYLSWDIYSTIDSLEVPNGN
jgi:hypothetical protein